MVLFPVLLVRMEAFALKQLAIGLALGSLMATSALAADLAAPVITSPSYSQTYTSPAYDWSGFYAGVIAGYGFGNTDISDGTATVSAGNNNGLLAGVTVGGNMQYEKFVFGVEGDIAWSGQEGNSTCAAGVTCSSNFDWTGTLRGRVGYAIDPVLIYATGGLAVARVNTSISPNTGTGSGSYSDTFTGWTIGGGVEAAVTESLSAKLEYSYADYGDKTAPANTLGAIAGTVSPTSHAVKLGLNYRF